MTSSWFLLRSCEASSYTNHDTTITTCEVPVHCVLGEKISNLSNGLSVVPDFSGDARNMVG